MAAAEYFNQNVPMVQSGPSYQPPTSQPNQYTHQPQQTQQAPPPPYQQQSGVHFAPQPVNLPQRHSFSSSRPSQHNWNHSPNSHSPQNGSNYLRPPQGYGTPLSAGQYTPQHKPQYLTPHMRPYTNPNSSQYSLENSGYSSDPEPHRRKHKNRRRRESGESRSPRPSSRSTNADAFIGAAGGGFIGDLIFPGLGTVGGAALGWLGGKDYGNHRKGREGRRAEEQRKWEEKHRPESRRGSGSRAHSRQGSSSHDR